jgi:hypothetical protein
VPRDPEARPRCRAYGFWGGDPFGSSEGARTGPVPQLWVAGGPVDVHAKGLDGLSLDQGSGEAAMGSCAVKGQGRAVLLTRRGTWRKHSPCWQSCWTSWATPTGPPPGPRSKGRSGDSWEKMGSHGRAKP